MSKKSEKARFFADTYDAFVQKANTTWPNPTPLHPETESARYLARLRLDALLYRRVVIPDGVFLDGAFFLDAAKFIKQLPLNRMEIRARARTLNEVVVGYVRRPDLDMLTGTYFTSMPPDQAIIAQQELPKFKASEVGNWQDVIRVFRSIKLDNDLIDSFEDAWGKWISFESSGSLNVKLWKSNFNFLDRLDKRVSLKYDNLRTRLTPVGKSIAERVFESRRSRNAVAGILAEVTAHDELTPDELADIATIRYWHDEAYNSTVAEHHECGTTEITVLDSVRPFSPDLFFIKGELDSDEIVKTNETLGIPQNFALSLGDIDIEIFNDMITDKKTEVYLENWYENMSSFANLHSALDLLVKRVDDERVIPYASPITSSIMSKISVFSPDEIADYVSEWAEMVNVKIPRKTIAGVISLSAKPIVHTIESVAHELKRKQIVRSIIKIAKNRDRKTPIA